MLNKAILQGRLVADPELRHTQTGTAVAAFCIACDRSFKSKDPNAQNADFINIVAWKQTAEFVSRYFTKGSQILVEGRIQVRTYNDNSGQKRYITEIVAESVNFCGSKRDNGNSSAGGNGQQNSYGGNGGGYGSYGGYEPEYQAPANDLQELNDDDGELPF